MKPVEVRAQIKAGQTGPLYLLTGDDLQSRHDLALEFAAVVDEGLQAFNVESFYGNEAGSASGRDQMMSAIVSTSRTLPMMAPRRIVIVHEAEKLLSPRKAADEDAESLPEVQTGGRKKRGSTTPAEDLEAYFAAPETLTTLVFVAGALDAGRRLVKALRKRAAVVDCGTIESEQEASAWIKKRLERDELTIDARAIRLLLATTGLSLGRIRAEVEKVVLYAAGESAVTEQHIRDLVMPETEPDKGPAVGMAIREGNTRKALHELGALLDAGVVPQPILGQIRWGAGQLRSTERVKRALELVLDTDLQMKSSAGEPRHLLERLVIDLCSRGTSR